MAIDVGAYPESGGSFYEFGGYTCLLLYNAANATGTISTFKILVTAGGTNCKVGSFYGSGLSYTNRDYYTIGTITGVATRTFTGIDFDITAGDFLGIFCTDGGTNYLLQGGSAAPYILGDKMGGGESTYTDFGGFKISIYGEGTEVSAGQPLKNVFGRPFRGCFR